MATFLLSSEKEYWIYGIKGSHIVVAGLETGASARNAFDVV